VSPLFWAILYTNQIGEGVADNSIDQIRSELSFKARRPSAETSILLHEILHHQGHTHNRCYKYAGPAGALCIIK
jgi:hypothetical protein